MDFSGVELKSCGGLAYLERAGADIPIVFLHGNGFSKEVFANQFLSKRLDELKVIDQLPADQHKVFFGAWVTLETDAGDVHRYRIVGAEEFDTEAAYISIDAPLARALIGKCLDDEISLTEQTPQGTPRILTPGKPAAVLRYVITDISYA